MEIKFTENGLKSQIKICEDIIKDIKTGNYRNASILIRFYLNDSGFKWYKDINSIIQDQISNLFYDIETNFKKNLTVGFFEHIISGLNWDIDHDMINY